MKKFNLQDEIKRIIKDKQLVEVRFTEVTGKFKAAYILAANSEFITLAEIEDFGGLDGVCMYRTDAVSSISSRTFYLNKLEKKIGASVLKQALKDVERVKEFTFAGFAAAFENTDTLVEVGYEADSKPAGKILGHDEKALLLVEYDDEFKGPQGYLAHSLIYFSTVARMSVDIPYMRDIAASLQ